MSSTKIHGGGLGDAPIEPRQQKKMNALAHALDDLLNGKKTGDERQWGFCLMVFEFTEGPGRCNYISNANRADVVTLLKEQLARFEGQAAFTCPRCGAVSYHPKDEEHGYCAKCHEFTGGKPQ
jgi:hypothetical protein